jgi:hypothetical protein
MQKTAAAAAAAMDLVNVIMVVFVFEAAKLFTNAAAWNENE